ncbi:glycosyltransferase [Hassallia byssoidea VB512170]|uniref:Glycosyltransferase n=1 Tax=Hassallia byssoidea VB512170 TaxID=1304833 RepID=A0A846HIQ3_9CYAN|nr:glycosyltransferase [Hassalia byssoidea]NEU76749.1 glycosyltransferase [Hassalia byssoidea VB512170]
MTHSENISRYQDNPLVSIIIANYNYARFIGQAIDSALSQTYQNIEVIVVDDGSTDNSQKIIASYGERVVTVFKDNAGQCSCYNVGFATSRGQIICFLDSDDILLPEKVAEVVKAFKSSEELGWCFHNLRWVDENAELLLKSSTQRSSRECDFRNMLKSGKLPPALPASSALCFRRSLLDKILPMPIAKAVSCSDFYVKYMAVALSKGCFLGKVLAHHRIHANNAATLRNDRQHLRAREFIFTGYWISKEFQCLKKFANKLVAIGISLQWHAGNNDYENNKIIKDYLIITSFLEKMEINLKACFYYLKAS